MIGDDMPDNEDGALGLSRRGGHAFMHWDRFMVWNALTGDVRFDAPRRAEAMCGALSEDGSRFAVGTADGAVQQIGPDGEVTRATPVSDCSVMEMQMDDRGETLLWRDVDAAIGVLDLKTGRARSIALDDPPEA